MEGSVRLFHEGIETYAVNCTQFDIDAVADALIRYVLVAAYYEGKWIFCRHVNRSTWELPGGKREPGETAADAARRELREETGASAFTLTPVCVYEIVKNDVRYGMLFLANVKKIDELGPFEIAEIQVSDELPNKLRFPDIQPGLFYVARTFMRFKDFLS